SGGGLRRVFSASSRPPSCCRWAIVHGILAEAIALCLMIATEFSRGTRFAGFRLDGGTFLRLKKDCLAPKWLPFRFVRASTLRLPHVVLAAQTTPSVKQGRK